MEPRLSNREESVTTTGHATSLPLNYSPFPALHFFFVELPRISINGIFLLFFGWLGRRKRSTGRVTLINRKRRRKNKKQPWLVRPGRERDGDSVPESRSRPSCRQVKTSNFFTSQNVLLSFFVFHSVILINFRSNVVCKFDAFCARHWREFIAWVWRRRVYLSPYVIGK